MQTIDADVLFRPESAELKFLPEGPYSLQPGKISWVAIQHGGDSKVGSINILDLQSGSNSSHELPGRPGFAFPTTSDGVFIVGLEHQLGLFDTNSSPGTWTVLTDEFETDVEGTIINDALTFDDNILLGCKDLEFSAKKAGLYLYRGSDQKLFKLRSDQTCSNGKAVVRKSDGQLSILDIDTPTKQVVEYTIDVEAGTIGSPTVVVDLTKLSMFPDGMILTPDGTGIIIAFYNPEDADFGEAHQYDLATGDLQTIWRCEKAPQVTCPQLVDVDGEIKLVLTTAVEHMPAERQAIHTNSGCLFIAPTEFSSTGEQPRFTVPASS